MKSQVKHGLVSDATIIKVPDNQLLLTGIDDDHE
jgi:hypothetical protein